METRGWGWGGAESIGCLPVLQGPLHSLLLSLLWWVMITALNEQVLTGFRQRHGSGHCILAFDGTCGQSAALQTVFRRTEKA